MRIDILCPPESELEVRFRAVMNLKRNLLKSGMNPAEIENAEISATPCEGKTQNDILVWDFLLDESNKKLLHDTVYASFGQQMPNRLINGSTGVVISERRHIENVH